VHTCDQTLLEKADSADVMADVRKFGSTVMAAAAVMIAVILVAEGLRPLLPSLYVIFVIGLIIWFVGRH
jgi:hypothetical protein